MGSGCEEAVCGRGAVGREDRQADQLPVRKASADDRRVAPEARKGEAAVGTRPRRRQRSTKHRTERQGPRGYRPNALRIALSRRQSYFLRLEDRKATSRIRYGEGGGVGHREGREASGRKREATCAPRPAERECCGSCEREAI